MRIVIYPSAAEGAQPIALIPVSPVVAESYSKAQIVGGVLELALNGAVDLDLDFGEAGRERSLRVVSCKYDKTPSGDRLSAVTVETRDGRRHTLLSIAAPAPSASRDAS